MQIYTLYRKGFSYVVWCPARFKHVDFGCVRLDSHSNHIFSRISGLTPYYYIYATNQAAGNGIYPERYADSGYRQVRSATPPPPSSVLGA